LLGFLQARFSRIRDSDIVVLLRVRALVMKTPAWFEDAKLGVIIHWGPYTIPSFAPADRSLPELLTSAHDESITHIPYSEWYWNAMRCAGSPTQRFHAQMFGEDYRYERFGAHFREATRDFVADRWAALLAESSVRYLVLTTKHHDGFLLWPSRYPNPRIANWHAERDLVGEVATALRARSLRFGAYYSGGLDWGFQDGPPITSPVDVYALAPASKAYADYILDHFHELIDRYRPDVLWNDLSCPAPTAALFTRYLAAVPDGVVNDRYTDLSWASRWLSPRVVRNGLDFVLSRIGGFDKVMAKHGDNPHNVRSYEYICPERIESAKWETTRGLGNSFGYNHTLAEDAVLSDEALLHLLLDVVAKNGNLLLGISVRSDGSVVPAQEAALRRLGRWLSSYGEGVFGTRPWKRHAGMTRDAEPLRLTARGSLVFAHVLRSLTPGRAINPIIELPRVRSVRLLGDPRPLAFRPGADNTIVIELPADAPATPHAYTLAIDTAP
jgi:alpha-L-fucosidase